MKLKLTSIGIDARKIGPTGIGRYTIELATALAKRYDGIHWQLFVLPGSGPLLSSLSTFPNISFHDVDAPYYSWREQFVLGRAVDRTDVQVFHATNFNTAWFLSTPLVATVQDLILLQFPGRKMWPGKRYLYELALGRTLNQSKEIIVGSNDTKTDVSLYAKGKGYKKVDQKITVIPHGVSSVFTVKMTDEEVSSALTISNPYFLMVGAQYVHKNVHRALEAFAQLIRDDKFKPYKMVLVGMQSPAPHVEAVIKQYPDLKDRLVWRSAVTDNELRALYHKAVALVFISQKEGFGLPILEAMACSCPVITSRVSAMPEVGGEAAWYVQPEKIESVEKAMRSVVNSKKEVALKIKQGLARVRDYTWQKAAEKTYSVYEKAFK